MSIAIASKWNGYRPMRLLSSSTSKFLVRSYIGTTVQFSESVKHPAAVYVDVSWGDGTTSRYTTSRPVFSHSYSAEGEYDIVVSDTLMSLGLPALGLREITEVGSCATSVSAIGSAHDVENLSGLATSLITALPQNFMYRNDYADSSVFDDLSWLPRKIREIPVRAFDDTPLRSLSGMPPVTVLRVRAFADCPSLVSLEGLPSSLTTIEDSAFDGCSAVTSLAGLPSGIVSLGEDVFRNCVSLASFDKFPDAVTAMPNGCFENTAITSFSPDMFPNVVSYGDSCFRRCQELTSVELDASHQWGDRMFYNCTSLVSADVAALTIVPYGMFQYCTSLSSISLPECTSISSYAFSNCTSLSSISLPECTSISSYAFSKCTSLSGDLSFPKLTNIGNYSFQACSSVESITANLVEHIGNHAFYAGSTSATMALSEVHFDEVYSMGNKYIFRGCTSLQDVYMEHRSYKQLLGEFDFRPMTGFPWYAPKGCVFHCRDGSITMTSAAGASSPTYTVRQTKPPVYEFYYDGTSQFSCRIDDIYDESGDPLISTVGYASALNGGARFHTVMTFPTYDEQGNETGTIGEIYSFEQTSSSVIVYDHRRRGFATARMSDLVDGLDFSQAKFKLLSFDVMGAHLTTFAQNAFAGQDELTDVHCERYSRAEIDLAGGAYDSDSPILRRIFGAPFTTKFHCSDGILYGNGIRG